MLLLKKDNLQTTHFSREKIVSSHKSILLSTHALIYFQSFNVMQDPTIIFPLTFSHGR